MSARWYIVRCHCCTVANSVGTDHGFSAGALAVIVDAAQKGEVTTVKGNSVCLVKLIENHVPRSTDPRFAFTEKVF